MAKPRRTVQRPQRVVGIGASAGGLDALKQLVGSVPADTGLAFVVLQHLPPSQIGQLASLLAGFTAIPVIDVANGHRIEPNTILVVPPHTSACVFRGALVLRTAKLGARPRQPIDALFASLADVLRERAVGVVLSGTASRWHRGPARDPGRGWADVRAGAGDRPVRRHAAQRDRRRRRRDRAVAGADRRRARQDRQARAPAGRGARSGDHDDRHRPDPRAAARGERDRLLQLQAQHDRAPARAPARQAPARLARRVQLVPDRASRRGERGLRGSADPRHRVLSRSAGARPARRARVARAPARQARRGAGARLGPGLLDRRGGVLAGDPADRAVRRAQPAAPAVRHRPERACDRDCARRAATRTRSRAQVGEERLARFFRREDGGYRINRDVRERCVFVRHDLRDRSAVLASSIW